MTKQYRVLELIDGDDYYSKYMTLKEAKAYISQILKSSLVKDVDIKGDTYFYSKFGRQCLLKIVD